MLKFGSAGFCSGVSLDGVALDPNSLSCADRLLKKVLLGVNQREGTWLHSNRMFLNLHSFIWSKGVTRELCIDAVYGNLVQEEYE